MKTLGVREPINLKVVRFELDFTTLAPEQSISEKKPKKIKLHKDGIPKPKQSSIPPPPPIKNSKTQKRSVKDLVEELLDELYADQRDWSNNSAIEYSHGSTSIASSQSNCGEHTDSIERSYLEALDVSELLEQAAEWEERLQITGERLARCVRARDRLRRQQKRLCAAFTVLLRHISPYKLLIMTFPLVEVEEKLVRSEALERKRLHSA